MWQYELGVNTKGKHIWKLGDLPLKKGVNAPYRRNLEDKLYSIFLLAIFNTGRVHPQSFDL